MSTAAAPDPAGSEPEVAAQVASLLERAAGVHERAGRQSLARSHLRSARTARLLLADR